MTNRYRSSCCCDGDQQSVCFLGYGAVPKTAYQPEGKCHPSSTDIGGFNRHDNWSFCVHDKDEEVCLVIDRSGYVNQHPVAWPNDTQECQCDCMPFLPDSDTSHITTRHIGRDPIVVWYKHPFSEGRAIEVPSSHLDDVYVWGHYGRNGLGFTDVSGKDTKRNTQPCACPPHKYSGGVGCKSDFFCDEGFFDYCGWTEPETGRDEQLYWWPDAFGNPSYLTQSNMRMIGHPTHQVGGKSGGWRTSEYGYVQPTTNNQPVGCGEVDGEKFGVAVVEGGVRNGMNSEYLYMQDIVADPSRKLFRNYTLYYTSQSVDVVPDWGWGSCTEYPFGLWPMAWTFWGVFHKQKWYQQYWNSISVNDVCENLPGGVSGCIDSIPTDSSGFPDWMSVDLFRSNFANSCRVPKFAVSECSGVPVFTHELVNKLDKNIGLPEGVDPAGGDAPDHTSLKVYTVEADAIIELTPGSLAAYVMACMDTGSVIDPDVTDYMEKVGILPPPVDYGEEKDYRIFKKNLQYYDFEGSVEPGHCCVNLAELQNVSDAFPMPLHCDCGIPAIDPALNAVYCGFTGTSAEAEQLGITTCWLPEVYADLNENGVADGVECARFVCGSTDTFTTDEKQQDYQNFLNDVLNDENLWVGIGTTSELAEELAESCCEDGPWDNECARTAQYATLYGECGPPTLCFDVPENICRLFLGGQHFSGSTCSDTINDDDIPTCRQRLDDENTPGSLCFKELLGGNLRIHCIEVNAEFGLEAANHPVWNTIDPDAQANYILDWADRARTAGAFVNGGSEVQIELLAAEITNSFQGIGTPVFTPLANCEPLCDATTATTELNDRARVCDPNRIPGECPAAEGDDYPCDDIETNPITFSYDDFYFYGRPGGWYPVCSPGDDFVTPGTNPPGTALVGGFQKFFPRVTMQSPGYAGACPGDQCLSASPFPVLQESTPIPSGTNSCPTKDSNDCEGNTDPGCGCEDVAAGDGPNCGEPLLAICGNGIVDPTFAPTLDEWGSQDPDSIWQYYPGPGDNSKNGINYDTLTPFCVARGKSYTCFGAWYQDTMTGFVKTDPDDDCAKTERYFCASVNNAFLMRTTTSRDENFCRNYNIRYTSLVPSPTLEDDGGDDDPQWTPSNEVEGETNVMLVYINRILDGPVQLYGGCTHVISQGDSQADLSNMVDQFGNPTFVEPQCSSRIAKWDLFTGNPNGEYNQPGGWSQWVTDPDDAIVITRNDGDPSDSSNPYTITIELSDFSLGEELNLPTVWWGLVKYEPDSSDLEDEQLFPDGEDLDCGLTPRNRNALWPSTAEQNKITIAISGRNPGDYPNGLRDYSWYHAPIKREGPLPSAFFPRCWDENELCCHTKRTQQIGQSSFVCDHFTGDRVQGQPGSYESECDFTLLPSDGDGLADPVCGPCEENEYCCVYLDVPRCIPDETYCCTECEVNEVCLLQSDGSVQCVDREEWENT